MEPSIQKAKLPLPSPFGPMAAGIAFTFKIALISFGLVKIPVIQNVGPLALAILIAVVYRQIWGYPEKLRAGIQFSSKTLLRCAIILYGLRLNMDIVLQDGLGLLLRGAITIVIAIGLTMLLAKWLKADRTVSLMLGVGTGVCGAAAIAAASPIVKAKEDDTAISVGLIALTGTIFAVGYTILLPFLPLTEEQYGIWSGISLHEIAHVALAGAAVGDDGLAMALLAKLGRVLLLIPLCFILVAWMRRKNKEDQQYEKVQFPWFLLGFIGMSLLGSYVFDSWFASSPAVMDNISNVTTFLLTMAMIGLGLNVNLKELRTKALRPAIVIVIVSVVLSFLTFWMV